MKMSSYEAHLAKVKRQKTRATNRRILAEQGMESVKRALNEINQDRTRIQRGNAAMSAMKRQRA